MLRVNTRLLSGLPQGCARQPCSFGIWCSAALCQCGVLLPAGILIVDCVVVFSVMLWFVNPSDQGVCGAVQPALHQQDSEYPAPPCIAEVVLVVGVGA